MTTQQRQTSTVTRRAYLTAAGIATTVGVAGCLGTGGATGTLATEVTDQPGDIADFESCVVTIQGFWVKPGESDDDPNETDGTNTEELDADDVNESDEREYHEFDEPQAADLVELQDETTQLIDERELEAGEYQFLQLDVTDVEGVLDGGESATVDTPGNAPLQFKHPFEIRENRTTQFVADFTPVRRGQTGRYLLQPVAEGTSVTYGDSE